MSCCSNIWNIKIIKNYANKTFEKKNENLPLRPFLLKRIHKKYILKDREISCKMSNL